jgi:glycosyl-4,4'-diaponeurosporenoate acyltransferase
MGVSYIMSQMRLEYFNPQSWAFRRRDWENDGRVYQETFFVKKWKGLLPEGAALFAQGFRKKHLKEKNEDYFSLFVAETCRSEAVHWVTMIFSPLFFLWNPLWVGVGMVGYALFANLPCIVTQRYNRIRLARVVQKKIEN